MKFKKPKFKFSLKIDSTQRPMVVTIWIIYLATLLLQDFDNLTKESFSGFTIFLIFFTVFYVYRDKIFKGNHWIYFIVQGLFVFDSALIMTDGFETIFLGLIPILIIQSMSLYQDRNYVVLITFLYYMTFGIIIVLLDGFAGIKEYMPLLILITLAVWAYNSMFNSQVRLRKQSQQMLMELESAYEKVDTLSREKERQKVARDLHDTLSQGLAGLVIQLEAIQANLEKQQVERASEIIENATSHARKTLQESREVIQNLRQLTVPDVGLEERLKKEIEKASHLLKAQWDWNISISSEISETVGKHMVFILREALNNIAKHSKATNVSISIKEQNRCVELLIKDNGIGFNQKKVERLYGHYGLTGIKERVKAINGDVVIDSSIKKGTSILVYVPLAKELKYAGL